MAHTAVLPRPAAPRLVPALVLAAWLALVLWLAASKAFLAPPGTPPLALLLAFAGPVAAFFLGYRWMPAFRHWVLGLDLRTLAAVQAWRFGGLAFLALWAHGVLPGVFAWPAGLGDMAIGATAPWIIAKLANDPRFAASRSFAAWNWLGILDLVVAVGTGAAFALLATGEARAVSTDPMASLPLVLIPAYLVPLFIMAHAAALLQRRRMPLQAPERPPLRHA
jgi:hypothetical protein